MICFVNVQSIERIIDSIFHRLNLEWKTRALRVFTMALAYDAGAPLEPLVSGDTSKAFACQLKLAMKYSRHNSWLTDLS